MRRTATMAMVLALGTLLTLPPAAPASTAEQFWKESGGTAVPADIARLQDHMNSLTERMKPALVQVRVRRGVVAPSTEEKPAPERERERERQEPRRTSGSGFIVRGDGYLVTNAHVVDGADRIEVKLADGRRFPGRTVGMDERTDLALVKIAVDNLPVASLGDSNRLRVGEFVLALGHPYGLEQTVSFGIVSRKGAPLQVAAPGFDFIQTDAAVNPGNSGGPLVNMAGEVVGINSMASTNGSIGFAIPVNLVKMLLPQLAEKGRVEWGWLGVQIAEVGDEDVTRLALRELRGVLIRSVVAGEPADKAALRADDVLLAIDGEKLEGLRDLQRIIASAKVGKQVKVQYMREGKDAETTVTIGAYQGTRERRAAPAPSR